jgi:hypothetical protein
MGGMGGWDDRGMGDGVVVTSGGSGTGSGSGGSGGSEIKVSARDSTSGIKASPKEGVIEAKGPRAVKDKSAVTAGDKVHKGNESKEGKEGKESKEGMESPSPAEGKTQQSKTSPRSGSKVSRAGSSAIKRAASAKLHPVQAVGAGDTSADKTDFVLL